MRLSYRQIYCCVATLLALAGRLDAQVANSSGLDRLLGPGDWVQVTIPGTIIESGQVQRVTADSLHVVDGGQEWFLSGSRIEALAVRERRTWKYTTGGAIGGALFGLAAQVFLNPVLCNEPDGCHEDFAIGALAGGLVFGVGIGLIGHHEFRWKPLIP
jgi:hypothetical protein